MVFLAHLEACLQREPSRHNALWSMHQVWESVVVLEDFVHAVQ